jgi:hypothetical protein
MRTSGRQFRGRHFAGRHFAGRHFGGGGLARLGSVLFDMVLAEGSFRSAGAATPDLEPVTPTGVSPGDVGLAFVGRVVTRTGAVVGLRGPTSLSATLTTPAGLVRPQSPELFTDGDDGRFVFYSGDGDLLDRGAYVITFLAAIARWGGSDRVVAPRPVTFPLPGVVAGS